MQIRALRSTLILAAVVILLLAQRKTGFMLLFLALPLLPWLLYNLYIIATQPARRKLQGTKMAIWVLTVLVIIGIHYNLHVSTRASADEVVGKIRIYSNERGSYPPNLEAIGMSNAQLRSRLGWSGYSIEAGKPHLSYASTYIPFHTERYDFESNKWRHVGD